MSRLRSHLDLQTGPHTPCVLHAFDAEPVDQEFGTMNQWWLDGRFVRLTERDRDRLLPHVQSGARLWMFPDGLWVFSRDAAPECVLEFT